MAYMRGKPYVWTSDNAVHFALGNESHKDISIPKSVLDEYVVMRHAEMTPAVRAKSENRAIEKHSGNFGCEALRKKHKLKTFTKLI
jgi:hypothetical protein